MKEIAILYAYPGYRYGGECSDLPEVLPLTEWEEVDDETFWMLRQNLNLIPVPKDAKPVLVEKPEITVSASSTIEEVKKIVLEKRKKADEKAKKSAATKAKKAAEKKKMAEIVKKVMEDPEAAKKFLEKE